MGLYIMFFSLFSLFSWFILFIFLLLIFYQLYVLQISFQPIVFLFFFFFLIYSLYILAVNLVLVVCATNLFLHMWFAFFVHIMYDVLWGRGRLFSGLPFLFYVVLIIFIICPVSFLHFYLQFVFKVKINQPLYLFYYYIC